MTREQALRLGRMTYTLACLAGYQRKHRNHLAPGYDVHKVTVHADDWPAVVTLMDALTLARGLT